MARVRLENITKRYGNETAVDDISLEVEDGEFVTFVGPSGCGKSTTMETVAGLTQPTEGRVYIGDDEVTGLAPKDRGVAMVFQNIALFPHMQSVSIPFAASVSTAVEAATTASAARARSRADSDSSDGPAPVTATVASRRLERRSRSKSSVSEARTSRARSSSVRS